MKKLTLLLTAAAVWTAAVYAEDAAVLPAKTLRLNTDASTGFVRSGWDGDGKKVSMPDAVIVGTMIGVSYGFTDWFTAVLDWQPGVTDTDLNGIDIGSDGNSAAEIYEGLGDFTVKGRFQIIGHEGPVSSERFRMTAAPGVVIPFPGIDDSDALGSHTWGIGGGVSFDTLIIDNLFLNTFNENFFVNIFTEFYFFPLDNQSKTNDKWDLSLEAGPHYAVAIGTAGLSFALPVNWSVSRKSNTKITDGVSSHLLTLRPTLALELTRPFRINITIEYACPLYGKNSYTAHTITVKAPVDFNFAKNIE